MLRRHVLRVLAAGGLLALAGGPAPAAAPDCDCPDGFEQVVESPLRLEKQAQDAIRYRKPVLAYRYASLLRLLHPDSPEAAEVYKLACGVFKQAWRRERLADPGSTWATSEPQFMFTWLASFFTDDAFPQKQAEWLLLEMPPSFFGEYQAFVARQAQYGKPPIARWKLEYQEDDGRLESIRATKLEASAPAAARPSGG